MKEGRYVREGDGWKNILEEFSIATGMIVIHFIMVTTRVHSLCSISGSNKPGELSLSISRVRKL